MRSFLHEGVCALVATLAVGATFGEASCIVALVFFLVSCGMHGLLHAVEITITSSRKNIQRKMMTMMKIKHQTLLSFGQIAPMKVRKVRWVWTKQSGSLWLSMGSVGILHRTAGIWCADRFRMMAKKIVSTTSCTFWTLASIVFQAWDHEIIFWRLRVWLWKWTI